MLSIKGRSISISGYATFIQAGVMSLVFVEKIQNSQVSVQ